MLKEGGTQRRWHPSHIHLVFHNNWNAVQGPDKPGGSKRNVETICLFERAGIDVYDCVEMGTLVVVRLDTIQIEPDELLSGQTPGFVGRMNIIDGGLDHLELLWVRLLPHTSRDVRRQRADGWRDFTGSVDGKSRDFLKCNLSQALTAVC